VDANYSSSGPADFQEGRSEGAALDVADVLIPVFNERRRNTLICDTCLCLGGKPEFG